MNKEDKLVFGEELLKTRRRKGLSRQQLADLVGVSPATIGNYENHINYPDMDKAIKIADALGVSLDLLLMDPELEKKLGINNPVIEAENQTDCTF